MPCTAIHSCSYARMQWRCHGWWCSNCWGTRHRLMFMNAGPGGLRRRTFWRLILEAGTILNDAAGISPLLRIETRDASRGQNTEYEIDRGIDSLVRNNAG